MKKLVTILFIMLLTGISLFCQALPNNLSAIKPSATTGPNADKLFKDLDRTYLEVYKAWQQHGSLSRKSFEIASAISKKDIIVGKVAQIRQNTQNSIDALNPFKPIPVIGTVAKTSQMALQTTARQMDKVKGKVEGFNNTALNPAANEANKMNGTALSSADEIYNTLVVLHSIKLKAADKCECLAGTTNKTTIKLFEQGAAKISKVLNEFSSSTAKLQQTDNKVSKIHSAVSKVNGTFDKTISSLDNFMSKFKASRKAVGEVNKVLDKRFNKKIFGKKISVSVRDVLSGGGALKKAKKWLKKVKIDIDKWARKALKPVTNKLGKKLPSIPGLDQFYAKADQLKNQVNEFGIVSNSISDFQKANISFRAKLQKTAEGQILNMMCTNTKYKAKSDAQYQNASSSFGNKLTNTAEGRIFAMVRKGVPNHNATAKSSGFMNITNIWKKTNIHIETGKVDCGNIAPGWHSAMWVIEPVAGSDNVRIKNRWKNTYLNIEHGNLQCGKIANGWLSAMWKIENIPGSGNVRIKNVWKGTYLNVEHGNLQCGKIANGWLSAMWVLNNLK